MWLGSTPSREEALCLELIYELAAVKSYALGAGGSGARPSTRTAAAANSMFTYGVGSTGRCMTPSLNQKSWWARMRSICTVPLGSRKFNLFRWAPSAAVEF